MAEKQQEKMSFQRVLRMISSCLEILFRPLLKVLKILARTLAVAFVLALILCAIVGVTKIYPLYAEYKQMAEHVVGESTPETFRLQESSYIYDADGGVLAKLSMDEDSYYLPYDEIPQYAVQAFVAVEDRTFWENSGVDFKGILRVGLRYLYTDGEEVHGASTITQQLARNRFLTNEVSLERKAKEILIARELTKKYTKEQIMEFYVNDISFANTYYGLEAAAIGYFGKSSKELSLSQIAYLCAIPNSPTYYNPYRHPDNALARRDKILDDMLEMGYITQDEHDSAAAEEIVIQRPDYGFHNYETTYAIFCAVRYLMEENGFQFEYGFKSDAAYEDYTERYNEAYAASKEDLYTGGYDIYTSLDPEKQQVLQDAVDQGLSFNTDTASDGIYALQGAATLIDNSSGKVEAIVGGRSQETDVYGLNRAYQSFRQPGSAIKPLIVYTPALENGYNSYTIVKNVDVDAAKKAKKGDDLTRLPGSTMTLRRGVEQSKNGVAWSVYADITPEVGMSYLTSMRFDNIVPGDYYLAASLGGFTHGVTSEEMAGAYAALANGGEYRDPTCIVSMLDKNGEEIFRDPKEKRVYEKNAALVMVDILTGVVTRGTASKMGWTGDIEAAGKTGTTNNSRDGWFCGITPYYTLTVWVGYDQPKTLSSLWGSTYPASIWKNAMSSFVEGLPAASFEDPGPETGTKKDVVSYTPPSTTEAPSEAQTAETEAPTEAPTEPVTGIHGGPGIGLD
ncbi:MAG TPA: transglycosylase domain-containing protein [Candidatus Lachnoclostridium pullistercoris]|uniref:Penicillin-binding protein 1A n=1 Tax=Candidatus Lachnoclostridium pullistercoris TaxID=2838632 RepID=A0A9D2PBQ3_9FIRM|nr:transglycosylase domain-containing protein [Candidatus Lachnoclostridium pullistercoris]